MFGTDLIDRAGIVGMFGEGHAHWVKISRLIRTHWYHVDVKIRNEGRMTSLVLMAGDEAAFVDILKKRGPDFELTQVQAVIPKWMNKTNTWSMEELTGLSLGQDKHGIPVCLLEVASGEVYTDVHDPLFRIDSLVEVKKIY
ncbi:hypothetical protein [Pseudomonas grandcourensis]|uniref:hypothetical protein n=1 Tax=Pseudomonas grandcourensis TaxID=3136736 RepID=UPI0032675D44